MFIEMNQELNRVSPGGMGLESERSMCDSWLDCY